MAITTRPGQGAGPTSENGMPSTHLSLHYHLVFSTKDRIASMHKDWRGRLHAYLGGIVNDLGGVPETIGGVEDHVHLLVGLRATHRLADVLRELKSASSRWVHTEINYRDQEKEMGAALLEQEPSDVNKSNWS
jgi:REP element-mobilizing transposase RayT